MYHWSHVKKKEEGEEEEKEKEIDCWAPDESRNAMWQPSLTCDTFYDSVKKRVSSEDRCDVSMNYCV